MSTLLDLASSSFLTIADADAVHPGGQRADPPPATFSDTFVRVLWSLGVRDAFGIVGGAIAPFAAALQRGGLRVIHCRHEAGAAFAATEAYFTSGRPSVVFTTTGPGILNALIGVSAARWDGANLIVVSGSTAGPQRGRWASQETSGYTMPVSGLYTEGPLFHYATTVEGPAELDVIARRLVLGLVQPGGFVAHVSLPIALQSAPMGTDPLPGLIPAGARAAGCNLKAAGEAARLLSAAPFVIWLGFGARGATLPILRLVERTGAVVMCSPRGKGIFPEDHPQFLGVTGMGGHDDVTEYLLRHRPDHVLVLGTRLGEATSFWDPQLLPGKGFIHVDLDPRVFGVTFPRQRTLGIQAEVGEFVQVLLSHLPMRPTAPAALPEETVRRPGAAGAAGAVLLAQEAGPVRPAFLMQAVQRLVVDSTDAVVMSESGNSFAWANHHLRFREAGRYRVSTGFGAMGHFTSGVLGAALGAGRKAVALVGDGALLMNNEINTAVAYRVPAVWIVLNDARYGMVEQGLRALGLAGVETRFPGCDFVQIARGMGADGVRVERERDVEPALRRALAAPGPFVVDVVVDPHAPSPVLRRVQSLLRQGIGASGAAPPAAESVAIGIAGFGGRLP